MNKTPHLFGIHSSNRDFTKKESWGKNQFNSSFPASLCCYLDSNALKTCYIKVKSKELLVHEISVQEIFGISPLDPDIYFAFEASHSPFQKFVIGNLPRTDLVIQKKSTGACLSSLEIKLTALPEHTTCNFQDSQYGSEIVVRPDTIVYLACSIAKSLNNTLPNIIYDDFSISDWTEAYNILPHLDSIITSIKNIAFVLESKQTPFLLQPIWKTKGKSAQLADDCLDVFCWSDAGFAYFLSQICDLKNRINRITRQARAAIWLYKMLLDISQNGHFDYKNLIDQLSYNTRNDKAFAVAGNITNKFMRCARLEKPVIKKSDIKHIILGGGQHLLSPERRFDALIFNTPDLFDS